MVNEHAIVIKGEISMDDIEYLVKKANCLGKSDRLISRVFSSKDSDGTHIYYEVEELKNPNRKKYFNKI